MMLTPLRSRHILRGPADSGNDSVIGATAADIAREGFFDCHLRWHWSFPQQSDRRDDHSSRAIAALHGVAFNEGLLHGMKPCAVGYAFDGRNFFAKCRAHRSDAGPVRHTIYHYSARAAFALAAPILGSGEIKFVAKDPEQWALRINGNCVALTVDN
jgi:hypothetical protein